MESIHSLDPGFHEKQGLHSRYTLNSIDSYKLWMETVANCGSAKTTLSLEMSNPSKVAKLAHQAQVLAKMALRKKTANDKAEARAATRAGCGWGSVWCPTASGWWGFDSHSGHRGPVVLIASGGPSWWVPACKPTHSNINNVMATIQNQNKGQPAEHEIQSPPGMIQPVFNGNESQSDLTQRTVLRVHGDLVPIRFKILYHIWLSTPQPAQDPYGNPLKKLEPEVGHALTYGHKHGHLSWLVIKASQWAHESKWPVTVVSQSGWSDLAERMAKDGARCKYTIQPTMQDPRPDVFPHLVDLPTYISPCDGPFGSGGRQPLIDIHVLYRVYINICTDDRSGEMLCHQVDSKFSSDSLTLQFELLKLDDLKSASIIHLKREHGPYPIAEIIQTACASTTSEVLWHYKLREPNQPPNRGSFMPGLGGSFAAFHSAAMLSTEEAKISVRIIMQKDQECCTVTPVDTIMYHRQGSGALLEVPDEWLGEGDPRNGRPPLGL
ncbi:hypothetical protein KEM48_004525 [Puccinia striiformis f. sp. tritici PST-130]|nr:hypothetical protein KEM48_004525 [Puccinia striiformis f. sp. tritici PST-130]